MKPVPSLYIFLLSLSVVFVTAGCSDSSDSDAPAPETGSTCAVAAPTALANCLEAVTAQSRACYADDNAPCTDDNPSTREALSRLQAEVEGACEQGEFLGLSVNAAVGRLQNACISQADSMTWRTFGGPQGAVWSTADDDDRECLLSAHETVAAHFGESLQSANVCVAENCDAQAWRDHLDSDAEAAAELIDQSCPDLAGLIAVDSPTYVQRADQQLDCTLATSHAQVSPLEPACGPSHALAEPARGEWSEIVLDGEQWGTLCGDGSEYAIHIRLAPPGSPLDRVIVGLQGGGVCLFESDCRSRLQSDPGLFNAQDDSPLGSGLVGDSPDNPFADWTRVYLPYCNQDVFIGGGIVETFEDFELPRYGAINLRAGIRVARDIIWRLMDEEGGQGFRPDQLIALFGGFSAGGYGTLYNYHWLLDDLLWPRTAAFPDAGLALDNGGVGVRTLGFSKIPEWEAMPYLPPYCFSGDCAVGVDNFQAFSPRLKQVPEQQYLILSNQRDQTQQRDAFFADEAQFIDTMRQSYCDTGELPGIQWYLTSESARSVHVVSIRDEFYYGEVAGEKMVDWLWRAVTDPDSIEDRAEEGNFVSDVPGVKPFPCALP